MKGFWYKKVFADSYQHGAQGDIAQMVDQATKAGDLGGNSEREGEEAG